jgi:hypothetical protein
VGLGLFEAAEQAVQLPLAHRWTHIVANLVIEHDQARGVALILYRQIKQGSGGEPRIVHFAYRVRRKFHGIAGVQQHGEHAVRFTAVAFQKGSLRACKNIPIHVAQIVARRISAVLGEFLAESEIRRAMQTVDEAVDDGLRHQIQAGNSGEHRRI